MCNYASMTYPRFIQWRIGNTLNRLIENKKWTVREAARALSTNKDTLDRYIYGKIDRYDPAKVLGWVIMLGGGEELGQEMRQLAELTRDVTASGYARNHDGTPSWFSPFITMEPEAAALDIYEAEYINGLFQVPEYMDAIDTINPLLSPSQSVEAQKIKRKRQEAAYGKSRKNPPPETRMILNEACLTRMVGTDFEAKQLEHLRSLNELDTIGIYVLPLSQRFHPSMDGSYTVMGFDDPGEFRIVYTDRLTGANYDEEPTLVEQYRKIFRATLALSIELEEYLNANQRMA